MTAAAQPVGRPGMGGSRRRVRAPDDPGARRDPDVDQPLDARSLQHADEVANASAAVTDRHEGQRAVVGHQPVEQRLDGHYAPSPR